MAGRVRIKICGLMRPEDILYVNRVQPDFAGFILAEGEETDAEPGAGKGTCVGSCAGNSENRGVCEPGSGLDRGYGPADRT